MIPRIIRVVRIGAIALGLTFLFWLSQQAGVVRGNEEVPGKLWAIGVVSLLFFVRAIVVEGTRGPEENPQKDLLWGLTAGCIITIIVRL